jgi:hypothetical protein
MEEKTEHPKYTAWSDSDSKVEFYEESDDLNELCEKVVDFVHTYDGEKYRVIVHIEDTGMDETIDTYENINPCDAIYESMYGNK